MAFLSMRVRGSGCASVWWLFAAQAGAAASCAVLQLLQLQWSQSPRRLPRLAGLQQCERTNHNHNHVRGQDGGRVARVKLVCHKEKVWFSGFVWSQVILWVHSQVDA